MSLRPRVDERPDACPPEFIRQYPWKGPQEQPISYHVCISHRNRMRINRWQNRLEKDRHPQKLSIPSYGFLKGCASQPQDMWVWKGLELIGAGRTSRRVLNRVIYRVHSFTDEHLTVQVHRDFGEEELLELPLREASDNLTLCYAAVYQSCQGRTLRNMHVLLMDTQHVHFSLRHLYVGASRVTSGQYLHIVDRSVARYIESTTEEVPLQDAVEVERDAHEDECGGLSGDAVDEQPARTNPRA